MLMSANLEFTLVIPTPDVATLKIRSCVLATRVIPVTEKIATVCTGDIDPNKSENNL